ncbi:DUF3530 family protein [Alishewanella sp. d11]|uniref:DUF3530 family protein n=1 Tax=Alishewanella sp. d11 TaxID=3414030 RepID=UPI003BF79E5F
MAKAFSSVVLLYLLFNQAIASTNWSDLQRQLPEMNVKQLESAELSLQFLREESARANAKGTVVIFPDQQQHALSPKLLNTLRLHLPNLGWHLLIMPAPDAVMHTSSDSNNSEQKIQQQKNQLMARWQLLNQQAQLQAPVVIIAQGEIAALINILIAENLAASPQALINLGAYLPDYQQNMQMVKHLAVTPQPLLDLITAQDHPYAIRTSEQRLVAARLQKNPLYRQRFLSEAYLNQPNQQWLLKEIIGWLNTTGF